MKSADATVACPCDAPAAMLHSSKDVQHGTWRRHGSTHRDVRDGKCLSTGNDAAGGHPFVASASSVSWMKSKGALPTTHA